MPDFTRANKYLAHALGISRREADNAIKSGRLTINGTTAELGAHIGAGDAVLFDNKPVEQQSAYTYILFHKPVGYVCSRKRQGSTPTIYEALPTTYRSLKPVGRLDKDSSGLILLTDDGDFAHRMTHPKFIKTKIYEVELDKPLEPLHQQMISDHGVQLEDGTSTFIIEKHGSEAHNGNREETYVVTMHEGRNRQIRRTFAALGYTVTKLHRNTFGRYTLGQLRPGDFAVTEPL
jgi:23S rRNA pseudouridine2605 synthase